MSTVANTTFVCRYTCLRHLRKLSSNQLWNSIKRDPWIDRSVDTIRYDTSYCWYALNPNCIQSRRPWHSPSQRNCTWLNSRILFQEGKMHAEDGSHTILSTHTHKTGHRLWSMWVSRSLSLSLQDNHRTRKDKTRQDKHGASISHQRGLFLFQRRMKRVQNKRSGHWLAVIHKRMKWVDSMSIVKDVYAFKEAKQICILKKRGHPLYQKYQ